MREKGKTKYSEVFKKNDKYGRYTIVNGEINLKKEAKVLCKCECGAIHEVACYTLIKGTSTQCLKCGNSLKTEKNPAWKGYGMISGKTFSKLKRGADLRGFEFKISLEFLDVLYKKQNMKCALTGLDLSVLHTNLTASVDRIDSNKGYIEDNIQWVHKEVNRMKNNYTQSYFIDMCRLISNNCS